MRVREKRARQAALPGGSAGAPGCRMCAFKPDWATWPQWLLLGLIICTFFVDAVAVWQCSPFVTNFLLDRGLNERWAGMFYGLNVLSAMCGTLLSPLLIKASSQTTVLLVGTSFAFIASVFLTYTPNSLWGESFGTYLIGLRVLMGFGEGMLQVGGISLAMRIAPESKVPLFAALSEGMRSLGSLVGPFMGGALFEAGACRTVELSGGSRATRPEEASANRCSFPPRLLCAHVP